MFLNPAINRPPFKTPKAADLATAELGGQAEPPSHPQDQETRVRDQQAPSFDMQFFSSFLKLDSTLAWLITF